MAANALHKQVRSTSSASLISMLRECSRSGDLHRGKKLHAEAVGCDPDVAVANTLIDMYAKCGSMIDAERVFDGLEQRSRASIVSCNALMMGYVEAGLEELALRLFERIGMGKLEQAPRARTFVVALKACAGLACKEDGEVVARRIVKLRSLDQGLKIHAQAAKLGLDFELFVATNLIEFYFKCGSLLDARMSFDRMPHRSVVSWNVLILGYVENFEEELALETFHWMEEPNALSFVAALKACSSLAVKEDPWLLGWEGLKVQALERVMAVHARAGNLCEELLLGNTLVDAYAKCRSMIDSRMVFDRMPCHSVPSWNALTMGYVESGIGELAFELFSCMVASPVEGLRPDARTFIAVLKGCNRLALKEEAAQVDGKFIKVKSLAKGVAIHREAAKNEHYASNVFLANTVLTMYSKCGSMIDARRLFDRMIYRDVVSWTVLILGYSESGDGELAWEVFRRMQESNSVVPDAQAFTAALRACLRLAEKEVPALQPDKTFVKERSLEKGRLIYHQAGKRGYKSDLIFMSTLVELYAKCWSMEEAREMFDKVNRRDIVLVTALMQGYIDSGKEVLALELFENVSSQGWLLDAQAVLAALTACTCFGEKEEAEPVDGRLIKAKCLAKGREIHSQALTSGAVDIFIANALLDLYSKCGSMEDAEKTFEKMPCRNVISWTSMMLAFCDNGDSVSTLEIYAMLRESCEQLNAPTFVPALKACSKDAVLGSGKGIHADIYRQGLESDMVLETCLLEMYLKCGSLVEAEQVFDSLDAKNVTAWNSLLAGYSRQATSRRVFYCFHKMVDEGLDPNEFSFLCVLTACSHGGFVEQGKSYFQALKNSKVLPNIEHYHCMVDILGRANLIDEALALVKYEMPFKATAVTWRTLLGACHKWNNAQVGKIAFDALVELDQGDNSAAYNLLANILKNEP